MLTSHHITKLLAREHIADLQREATAGRLRSRTDAQRIRLAFKTGAARGFPREHARRFMQPRLSNQLSVGRGRPIARSAGARRVPGTKGDDWEQLIRNALHGDGLELFCQPIVSLASDEVTHCEVLLRMRRNDGVVLPGAFLPTAERVGLIHAVDFWVIGHSIAAAAAHPEMRFAINLSGRTINDARLPKFVAAQLVQHGAIPGNIMFELTETAAVINFQRACELARALELIGCSFALDDFGCGYSTFSYLKHFPARYLKIDGDFVRSPRSRIDDLVIESIVRIAKGLGKQTIAEFVTDADTYARMKEFGVDGAQGFHVARPFPLNQLGHSRRPLTRYRSSNAARRASGGQPAVTERADSVAR